MTRLHARLTLAGITAIFLATASNALFLQDRGRLFQANGLPSTSVSVTQFPSDRQADASAQGAGAVQDPEIRGPRLQVAIYRELWRRGYNEQLRAGPNGLRVAVLAYEFDNGQPLTGEPTEELLKRLLFDINQAPRGSFTDRAELNTKLIIEAQKALLGLGFFRGAFSGRMDVWTSNAIRDFERHRGIPVSGRLTGQTLLELIIYSGQPIQLSSG
jgi:hypothetical protein